MTKELALELDTSHYDDIIGYVQSGNHILTLEKLSSSLMANEIIPIIPKILELLRSALFTAALNLASIKEHKKASLFYAMHPLTADVYLSGCSIYCETAVSAICWNERVGFRCCVPGVLVSETRGDEALPLTDSTFYMQD